MANEAHFQIIRNGVKNWNAWRESVSEVTPDLSKGYFRGWLLPEVDLSATELSKCNLSEAVLCRANLSGARLRRANLFKANMNEAVLANANCFLADLGSVQLNQADLSMADLHGVRLSESDLTEANLSGANLTRADLFHTTLVGADLSGANLTNAILVEADLSNSKLNDCRVYGVSAWNVNLEGAEQHNLIITPPDEPTVTVDNLKVAQFIYLLLSNPEVRQVIDTITSKVVLILGRFTPERKKTLDAIHVAVRQAGYVPIMFDFDKPASLDFMETVSILASMARFVIADLTDEKVVLAELYQMVREHPSKPVQPILLKGKPLNVLVQDFRNRGREAFLPIYEYSDDGELLETLADKVIAPAERLLTNQQEHKLGTLQ